MNARETHLLKEQDKRDAQHRKAEGTRTFKGTVRKVHTNLPQKFGSIKSVSIGDLVDHDVEVTVKDLGLAKRRSSIRKVSILDVVTNYIDELAGEPVNDTDLLSKIQDETGHVLSVAELDEYMKKRLDRL